MAGTIKGRSAPLQLASTPGAADFDHNVNQFSSIEFMVQAS